MHAKPAETKEYHSTDEDCDENHKEFPSSEAYRMTCEMAANPDNDPIKTSYRGTGARSHGIKSIPMKQTIPGKESWAVSSGAEPLGRFRHHYLVSDGSNTKYTKRESFRNKPETLRTGTDRRSEKMDVLLGTTVHAKTTGGQDFLGEKIWKSINKRNFVYYQQM